MCVYRTADEMSCFLLPATAAPILKFAAQGLQGPATGINWPPSLTLLPRLVITGGNTIGKISTGVLP